MESLVARLANIKPISRRPAIEIPRATRPFPAPEPAPVPEPPKPCPVVQSPNIVSIPDISPAPQGQHKALPLVF
jgi:hypothetical protein